LAQRAAERLISIYREVYEEVLDWKGSLGMIL